VFIQTFLIVGIEHTLKVIMYFRTSCLIVEAHQETPFKMLVNYTNKTYRINKIKCDLNYTSTR
jgi:hypothetical protein